jgi:O-antigen/teichoic acid export membrane protein
VSGKIGHAIAGNALAGAAGRLIAALGPILVAPLMIRHWGLPLYGEWLILNAIPAYVMLAPDFGLAGAVVNRMPFLAASGRQSEAVALYRSSFAALVVASGAFVLLGWSIGSWIDWSWLGVRSLPPRASGAIISWCCVYIFVAQQNFLLSGIYRSARRNARYSVLGSVEAALLLFAGVAVLLLGGEPVDYAFAVAATKAVFFVVVFVDSRVVDPRFTLSARDISFARVRPYVMPGLGHAGMPLVHALQNQGVLLVLGALLGPASVGIFQTARVLSNGVKSVYGIFSTAVTMELPTLLGEGRRETVEHLLIRNVQAGAIIAACALLGTYVAGEWAYTLWLHGKVAYDAPLVLALMASLVPSLLGQPFVNLTMARNEIHRVILMLLAMAVLSLAVSATGALLAGLVGAAAGVVAWELGLAYVVWSRIPKSFRLEMNDFLALRREAERS